MEGTFIFIVMFAGAAIALLAVFLVASEKELKKKRLEIDQLLARLGDAPASDPASGFSPLASDSSNEELESLRARNRQLEQELAAASNNQNAAVNVVDAELEAARRNVEIAKSNAQWLQNTNEDLKAEIENLKKRLQASEGRSENLMTELLETSDPQRSFESELANLREQLAASQARIEMLENMEHKAANVDAAESHHRNEKHALESKIAELEKALSSAAADKTSEADTLRQRLAESERTHQSLRDERNGLAQEIARLQPKAMAADEQGRWFKTLQEQFGHLLAKQTALSESQREYQEAVADYSQLLGVSSSGSQPVGGFNEFNSSSSFATTEQAPTATTKMDANGTTTAPQQVIAAAQAGQKPKRRFGIFPAAILFISATSIAAGLWSMRENDTTPTVTASALPPSNQNQPPAAPVETVKHEVAASEPIAAPISPAAKELQKPAVKDKPETARPVPAAKVSPPATGTYEITRSSRVYAAPSELSQAMGDIEPGVRVNVVGSKNGWLEIHSKHGRPPGFIRQEGARVSAQN